MADRVKPQIVNTDRIKPSATPPKTAQVRGSTETVTVACKLPNGLLLRLFDMKDQYEPAPGGSRLIKLAVERVDAGRVRINGFAVPYGQTPQYEIPGGFALTHNVPKDFFEEWLSQNQQLPAVSKGLIFAAEKRDDAIAEANEKAELKSGLEPVDPVAPPRGFKNVEKFEKDDKAA